MQSTIQSIVVRRSPFNSARFARAWYALVAVAAAGACGPKPKYMAFRPAPSSALSAAVRPAREPAPAVVVKADLSEWKISLGGDNVAAGPVTFRVHNSGATAHALEVEGNGIEKRSREIAPDSTITFTVTLTAGQYEIYCPVAGGSHKQMGMQTALAVRPPKT